MLEMSVPRAADVRRGRYQRSQREERVMTLLTDHAPDAEISPERAVRQPHVPWPLALSSQVPPPQRQGWH